LIFDLVASVWPEDRSSPRRPESPADDVDDAEYPDRRPVTGPVQWPEQQWGNDDDDRSGQGGSSSSSSAGSSGSQSSRRRGGGGSGIAAQ
jgi:hypothetical protein